MVVATDGSAAQIAHARPHPGVHYGVMLAEAAALADASFDLVTVAQALHWLDRTAFYAVARRVLKPGGVLGVWCYGLPRAPADIAAEVAAFSSETVGAWWPARRHHVDTGYTGLEFPFQELESPPLEMSARWSLAELLGYVGTWSAVSRCREETGADPVAELARRLAPLWPDGAQRRSITWPLFLRAGRA